ncbi:HNH endonuclease [Chloroflexota bacterium]
MTRNPDWTRDELLLTLDLYFRVYQIYNHKGHPEIVELSNLLNSLPIHPRSGKSEKFRNPNGVYMKLCNFLRFDPSYEGTGLPRGSKLDEKVWEEFYSDREHLSEIASSIKNNYRYLTPPKSNTAEANVADEDEEFPEGQILSRLHRQRERSSKLVRKKKGKIMQLTGRLACEVCNFDFAVFYGELGFGFAECHHNVPISIIDGEQRIKISDLSITCANCHRMIHRTRPWLAIQELRDLLGNSDES